jgi:hypothetical protein
MGIRIQNNSEMVSREHLEFLYKKLQDNAYQVAESLESQENSNDYLCLVVLEDDVSCLLEECSKMLRRDELPAPPKLVSFESRCMTVFDEIELALGGDPDSTCHSIAWNEVIPAFSQSK